MDQDLINMMIGMGAAVFGWFMRVIWQSVRDLQIADQKLVSELHSFSGKLAHDLHVFKEHVPVTYVSKADFAEILKSIHAKLDRICDKLDNKQDRSES